MVFLRRKVENLSQVRLMTKNIISESDLCAVNLIVDGGTCLPVLQIHSFPFRLRLSISMVFLRRKVENLSQVRLMTKNIISESDLCAVNLIVDGGTCLLVLQILLLCVWLCPTHRKCRHNTSSKQAV